MASRVKVLCIGVSSSLCTDIVEVDVSSSELCSYVAGFLEEEKATIIVSASLRGFSELYKCLEDRALNTLLLDVAPAFEAVAAGVDIDTLVEFRKKLIEIEYSSRLNTHIWSPPIPRRRLFSTEFWLSRPRLKHVVVPRVVEYNCIKGCRLCVEICPYNALSDNPPTIDSSRCSGCTLCVQICPTGAVYSSVFSRKYFEEVINFVTRNRIDTIIFACWRSLEELEEKIVEIAGERALVVHMSCSYLAPVRSLLELALNGFKVLMYCPRQDLGEDCTRAMEYVSKLIGDINKIANRIVISYNDSLHSAREIEPITYSSSIRSHRGSWADLIRSLVELTGSSAAEEGGELELLPLFNVVVLEPSRCIGCTAPCVENCPTNALVVRNHVLYFSGERCVGCSKCVEVCPASNISIERSLSGLSTMRSLAELSREKY